MVKRVTLLVCGLLFLSFSSSFAQQQLIFRRLYARTELRYLDFKLKQSIQLPGVTVAAVDKGYGPGGMVIIALVVKNTPQGGIERWIKVFDEQGALIREFRDTATGYEFEGRQIVTGDGSIKITPDENVIVTSSKKVAVYDLRDGKLLYEFALPEPDLSSPEARIVGIDIKEALHIEQEPGRSWVGVSELAVAVNQPDNHSVYFARPIRGIEFYGFGSGISIKTRTPGKKVLFLKGMGYMPDGRIAVLVMVGKNDTLKANFKLQFYDRRFPDFPEVKEVTLDTENPDIRTALNIPITLKVTPEGNLMVISLNGNISLFNERGEYLGTKLLLKEKEQFMSQGIFISEDEIILPAMRRDGSIIYILGP